MAVGEGKGQMDELRYKSDGNFGAQTLSLDRGGLLRMQVNQKKLDQFQTRMSAWVAGQGLLFQLSHGGRGASSAIMGWVTRITLRLSILLAVGAVLLYGYLMRKPFSPSFGESLQLAVQEGLGAESVEMGPTGRKEGQLDLSSLEMEGSEGAFFDRLRARNIKTRMRILSGTAGVWRGEVVSAEQLDVKVKSGSERLDSEKVYGAIFHEGEGFTFDRVEVEDATISWGYSASTAGGIRNTRLSGKRNETGWRLKMKGGTFSQNWLKDLTIESLECQISNEGVQIVDAQFSKGEGKMVLAGRVRGPVVDPQVELSGNMKGFPLAGCLQSEVAAVLNGRVSGEVQLGGSPYGASGITVSAQIVMAPGDEIIVTDEIELLDVISLVDRYRSYKKIRFRSGGFNLETGKNVAVISDIRLEAKDHARLEGGLLSRRPSDKEISRAIFETESGRDGGSPGPQEQGTLDGQKWLNPALRDTTVDGNLEEGAATPEFNLADAARAARSVSDSGETIRTIFQSEVFGEEVQQREEAARAAYRRIPYLEGEVRMGLNARAFEEKRSPALAQMFPVEEGSGLRWLRIRLDQSLPFAGADLAEKILSHGKD